MKRLGSKRGPVPVDAFLARPVVADPRVLDAYFRKVVSSRPPAATFSRRRLQPTFGTMSRFPSSEPTGRRTMGISAPRSLKRN